MSGWGGFEQKRKRKRRVIQKGKRKRLQEIFWSRYGERGQGLYRVREGYMYAVATVCKLPNLPGLLCKRDPSEST